MSDAISIWWALNFPEFCRAAFVSLWLKAFPPQQEFGFSAVDSPKTQRVALTLFDLLEELTKTRAVGLHPQEALSVGFGSPSLMCFLVTVEDTVRTTCPRVLGSPAAM